MNIATESGKKYLKTNNSPIGSFIDETWLNLDKRIFPGIQKLKKIIRS